MTLATLAAGWLCAGVSHAAPGFVPVAGGRFTSVLPAGPGSDDSTIELPAFHIMVTPVTNGEFLAFLGEHPEWRRDRVPRVFAEQTYLDHWPSAVSLGAKAAADQPVTRVSWFAAQAYCEAQQARLPTWHEYEHVLAADATRIDARQDAAWRERMLSWYSRPSGGTLPAVGRSTPNIHGIRDLHGLVWEWALDFNALLVSADNRNQGDAQLLKFCGEGALAVTDRDNYPVLMRLAMLSALQAGHTTRSLGFRCARDGGRNGE